MAKKYKRSLSSQSRPAAPGVTSQEQKPAVVFARRDAPAEFNPDYTYIRSDLKRIGILSGTFFVVLIVLSYVLPLILH
jgi:hypothetical protein